MDLPNGASGDTVAGVACGTLLVVLVQIPAGDVVKTIVLAMIGAVVSFSATVCLKWLRRLIQKKKRGE